MVSISTSTAEYSVLFLTSQRRPSAFARLAVTTSRSFSLVRRSFRVVSALPRTASSVFRASARAAWIASICLGRRAASASSAASRVSKPCKSIRVRSCASTPSLIVSDRNQAHRVVRRATRVVRRATQIVRGAKRVVRRAEPRAPVSGHPRSKPASWHPLQQWAHLDSNQDLTGYEPAALPLSYGPAGSSCPSCPRDHDSRKLRSFLERDGCRSLRNAL